MSADQNTDLKFTSPYTPNTKNDRAEMLKAIGVKTVDDLFRDIPENYLNPELKIPDAISEMELVQEMEELAGLNAVPGDYASFLGSGAYRHFIPSIVNRLALRSEFMTCYTPYQPEVSQGTLQAHFEFQSMVCQLTGMDVANAGMYDGSTALSEAVLMACRVTKKSAINVLDSVSPQYKEVLKTFLDAPGIKMDSLKDGMASSNESHACLIVQQPNYFGYFEDLTTLSDDIHKAGGLLIVLTDPISLGMYKTPADYGADIVVAEGQSLGISTSYGGPYVGLFACKQDYIRQMPGRIVGRTKDTNGETGYVLTLQTREQHIRRDRATSNICTSVGLIALMSTIYMISQGKQGLKHIANLCYQKAHYAAAQINDIQGYSVNLDRPFFKEFVISCPISPAKINKRLLSKKIIGGIDVSSQIKNGMLVCITETNSRQEIDSLVTALREISAEIGSDEK
ncbi:MAG: aminomethyl-transferring glycine dehydrogenase [Dehalococcoidia bacterium]|nr:aminomethyl-transferring glycine dehydrogenase [Dehalococcoidia bacterium]MQG16267.1 aminomethyl-transferring glycine dehydrogenase subunit GcvPA [SAR202 cluster bacterium]|tara:strand:+ start:7069 stop:8430 length:1362 start_codon:yes stop_codon:yes gene_type:complete